MSDKTVYQINQDLKAKNKTKNNTFEMFPIGTRIKVICCCQDFVFFNGNETGVVIKNGGSYLSIIVKFDEPLSQKIGQGIDCFNFNPEDLIVYDYKKETVIFNRHNRREKVRNRIQRKLNRGQRVEVTA